MHFPRAPGASHSREWAAPTRCAKPLYQRPRRAGRLPPSVSLPSRAPGASGRAASEGSSAAQRDGQKPGARARLSRLRAGRGLTGPSRSAAADAARVTPKPSRTREPESLSLAGTSPFITYCTPTGFTLWSALNPTPRPARARVSLLSKGLGPTMTSPDSSPGKTTTTDPLNLVPRISIATTPLESGTVTE